MNITCQYDRNYQFLVEAWCKNVQFYTAFYLLTCKPFCPLFALIVAASKQWKNVASGPRRMKNTKMI